MWARKPDDRLVLDIDTANLGYHTYSISHIPPTTSSPQVYLHHNGQFASSGQGMIDDIHFNILQELSELKSNMISGVGKCMSPLIIVSLEPEE